MPVLEIYLGWVNSVLAEVGGHVSGVEAVQDGKVLCELIDVLVPKAGLVDKVKLSGDCRPLAYINSALDHMKEHGIKVKFSTEDILHNGVKSMLDVLWILILNYGIHPVDQDPQQRSVGVGKRNLLDWCQQVLETTFDSQDTLSFSLCRNNSFIRLLENLTHQRLQKLQDKTEYIESLLNEIQALYFIQSDIIRASDITDGTVDEHTMMIYLSLLQRRTSTTREALSDSSMPLKSESMGPAQVTNLSQSMVSSKEIRSNTAEADEGPTFAQEESEEIFTEAKLDPFGRFSMVSTTSELKQPDDQFDTESRPHLLLPDDWTVKQTLITDSHTYPNEELQFQLVSEKDLEKEIESQMISEKETDTQSELANSGASSDNSISVIQSAVKKLKDATHDIDNEPYSTGNDTNSTKNETYSVGNETYSMGNETYSLGDGARSIQDANIEMRNQSYIMGNETNHMGNESYSMEDDTKGIHDTNIEMRNQSYNMGNSVQDEKFPIPETTSLYNVDVNQGSEHSQVFIESNITSAEQQSARIPETTHYEDSTEENVKIRRPKDYIRQWENTMDRLSGVSVSDEFGSPMSPLISGYRVSPPIRSKSLEAKEHPHRIQASSSFGKSYDLNPKSKSSSTEYKISISSQNIPSSILVTETSQDHRRKISTATAEMKQSSSMDEFKTNFDWEPKDTFIQDDTKITVKSNVKILEGDIDIGGEDAYLAGSSPYCDETDSGHTSQKFHPQISTETGQHVKFTIRSNSEPPLSSTRVRFEPAHLLSQQITQSEVPDSHSFGVDLTETSSFNRNLSLSPRKPTSYSRDLFGSSKRESGTMLSIASRSRSVPPQQSIIREQVEDILSPQQGQPLENVSSLYTQRQKPLANSGFRQAAEDSQQSEMPSLTNHLKHGNTSVKTFSGTFPLEKPFSDKQDFKTGWGFNVKYSRNDFIGEEDIQSPVRNGGAGRVPRREAWELERQKKEEASRFRKETDSFSQSELIEKLFREIEMLRHKVETLENSRNTRNITANKWTSSAPRNTVHRRLSYDSRDVRKRFKPSHHRKQSPEAGHERATSCPLLQPSRRSTATRSLSRIDTVSPGHASVTRNPGDPYVYFRSTFRPRTDVSHSTSGYIQKHDSREDKIRGNNSSRSSGSSTPESWDIDLNMHDNNDVSSQERWNELILQRDLSESDTIELKQALAYAVSENNILQAKLNNAREEIHDKLKHTNSVLDDCRRHLARAQAENMELRTMLGQEQQKSESFGSKNKELEKNITEVKTDNQLLENDLDQTSRMLDHSLTRTIPGIEALEDENSRLVSRLTDVEYENDGLREEIHILKRNQIKAMDTMDSLRECLSKVRHERHELFNELASLGRLEDTGRVRKAHRSSSSSREKGVQDEWEREENMQEVLAKKSCLKHGSFGEISSDCLYCSHSPRTGNRNCDNTDRIMHGTSGQYDSNTAKLKSRESSSQQAHHYKYMYSDQSLPGNREIYPHRKGYISRSRSSSPHYKGSRSASAGSYSPEESYFSATLENKKNSIRDTRKLTNSSTMFLGQRTPNGSTMFLGQRASNGNTRFLGQRASNGSVMFLRQRSSPSYSPKRQSVSRSPSPSHTWLRNTSHPTSLYPTHAHLNMLFSSTDDLVTRRRQSNSPLPRKYPSIMKSDIRSRERIVTGYSSPSYTSNKGRQQNISLERHDGNSRPRSQSPDYRPFSTGRDSNRSDWMKRKKKQYSRGHEAEEVDSKVENEYDEEDKLVNSISKFLKFTRKPRSEIHSESDGEDTGINSSMSSSMSGYEQFRSRTPVLTDDQRRYADELIQKYLGDSHQHLDKFF